MQKHAGFLLDNKYLNQERGVNNHEPEIKKQEKYHRGFYKKSEKRTSKRIANNAGYPMQFIHFYLGLNR
jgi:hypothetical protein